MNQNRNAVWVLVALVAVVVGGEYFLLLYVPPRDVGWYNKLLNVYMKGGWLIRLVFALIIPMAFAIPDDADRANWLI